MNPLKAEITAVAAALSQEHESVEDAARAAIVALDEARVDRTLYGVAIQGLPCAYVYHPFGNKQEALSWIKRYGVAAVDGLEVGVIPLFSKERLVKRHAEAMADLLKRREAAEEPPRRGGRRKKT